jgi:two-component system, cell cycle response regulator
MRLSVLNRSPARRAAFVAVGCLLAVHVAHAQFGLGGAGVDALVNAWLYAVIEFGCSALVLWRGISVARDRAAWLWLSAGLLFWSIGDLLWTLWLDHVENPPYPSIADACYLLMYPCFYIAITLLLRARVRAVGVAIWLDGIMGGLAIAALSASAFAGAIIASSGGSPAVVITNLAYPMGDLVLLALVMGAFGLAAWRPGPAWVLLGLGMVVTAIGDTFFLYQQARGTYAVGTALDSVWPAGMLLLAGAAWQQPQRWAYRTPGVRTIALAGVFMLLAVALQVYDHFERITPLALALDTAALLAGMLRAGLTYTENARMLRHSRHEALTDGLSGLPNRRWLQDDLEAATSDGQVAHTLAFFDLDGFKHYNDTFGHPVGDSLLARLGSRLADAVGEHGRAYRLGGDEFCVLLRGRFERDDALVVSALEALSEHGKGFAITASCGLVAIPDAADDATHAMQLADERMYRDKNSRRVSGRRQARDVLLQVLTEREPDLHDHLRGVAQLAVGVGRRMGLDSEQLDILVRGAELHDIGKVAIPEVILHKRGPLDESEWTFVRQHTIIGERILAAAPALAPVARVVRASHERWDGVGYPDGLEGEEIPLAARIIAVCDAFDAMVSDRPYRAALGPEEAISELRRCAGSQFDPAVVEAFAELQAEESLDDAGQASRSTRTVSSSVPIARTT